MAFYNFVFRTSAGDELLYEGDSDKLMRDLEFSINGSNCTGTVLVEDEKLPIRKQVFEELSRIRSLFKQNENVTGFEIFDSFQYSKERKFSIEFLEANVIEVTKIEEEEDGL
ncbi:MAG: hypothetical protein ACFN24_02835 [Candidatus Nanogingivalis sp.]